MKSIARVIRLFRVLDSLSIAALSRFGLGLGEIASDAEDEGRAAALEAGEPLRSDDGDEFRGRLTLGEGEAGGCAAGGKAIAVGDVVGDKSVAGRFNFSLFASAFAFSGADTVEAALAVCSRVGGALLRSGKMPAVIALANPE